MEEIRDPLEHTMLPFLTVPEFLQLCSVNTQFASFCQSPSTWRYFIRRDFAIDFQGDYPKDVYFKLEKEMRENAMINERLKKMKISLELGKEDGLWDLYDLIGYEEEEVFDKKFLTHPEDDLATQRLVGILCNLSQEELDGLDLIHQTLAQDFGRFGFDHSDMDPLFVYNLFDNALIHGRDFFKSLFNVENLLEYIHDENNQQDYGHDLHFFIHSPLTCILDNRDPILRNLF